MEGSVGFKTIYGLLPRFWVAIFVATAFVFLTLSLANARHPSGVGFSTAAVGSVAVFLFGYLVGFGGTRQERSFFREQQKKTVLENTEARQEKIVFIALIERHFGHVLTANEVDGSLGNWEARFVKNGKPHEIIYRAGILYERIQDQ